METSMNMDSLKSYSLPIIAVMVVVAAVPLAIMPWYGDITTNLDKISTESARRDILKTKADALEEFDVTENKTLLERTVLPAIPAEKDPSGLLGTVEQVARLSGIGLRSVTYSDAASKVAQPVNAGAQVEGLSHVTVSVTVEGTYEQIASFIARSEMVSRVLTLDTLHIVRGDDGNPHTASFEVRSPYVPHPTTLALEAPFEELSVKETAVIDHLNTFDEVDYSPTAISNIVGKTNPF